MWLKLLKYELYRLSKDPLCIAYCLFPVLTVAVDILTYEERSHMFEITSWNRTSGIMTMLTGDNMLAWLFLTTVIVSRENYFDRHLSCTFRRLPVGITGKWLAKSRSLWRLSATHWTLFFGMSYIYSGILFHAVGAFSITSMFCTFLTSGCIMLLAYSLVQFIDNGILFIFIFFTLFVVSGFGGYEVQKYNIFTYAAVRPYLTVGEMWDSTRKFMIFILPLYYILSWITGLAGSRKF